MNWLAQNWMWVAVAIGVAWSLRVLRKELALEHARKPPALRGRAASAREQGGRPSGACGLLARSLAVAERR